MFRSSSSFIIFHRFEQFAIAKRGWTAREYITYSLLFVGYEYDPVGTQRTYNAEISFIKWYRHERVQNNQKEAKNNDTELTKWWNSFN